MNITYNGQSSADTFVTFTDIPNILRIDDNNGYGNNGSIILNFLGNLRGATSSEGQWEITVMGETITSTLNVSNSVNKNFYVATAPASTAAYATRALRNCPTINALFTVEHGGGLVTLTTRTPTDSNLSITTNIPTTYLTTRAIYGVSPSVYEGATIGIDVWTKDDDYVLSEYVTTLEKQMYNGRVEFDMSPLLTTLAREGETRPYSFTIHALNNGEYSVLSNNIKTNYIINGYMCNQGDKFLPIGNPITLAANYSRGASSLQANNTLLYVYGNTIPFSFYTTNTNSRSIYVDYYDSAFNQLNRDTISWTNENPNNLLKDMMIELDQTYLSQAFYIDVSIDSITLRYNVIKPLKTSEGYQRIYWRNSYGGVSFFDFCGQRSEVRNFETTTYNTNIFNYYDNPKNELQKVFDVDVDYVVTLKSHLFDNDGKYIFNDMIQSHDVWTVINGETYAIIFTDVAVDEQSNNNIYEATVKYKYSQKPSLL